MRRSTSVFIGAAFAAVCSIAQATTFHFDADPFAGTPLLTIPSSFLMIVAVGVLGGCYDVLRRKRIRP